MSRISKLLSAARPGLRPRSVPESRRRRARSPTYAVVGALPAVALGASLNAEAVLAAGSLPKQDIEAVKLAVGAATGCDDCHAAHSLLAKLGGLKPEVIRKIRANKAGNAQRDVPTC